ncbi:hypothetical protein GCM10010371_57300 [Streptomyces subrutilus]|uniref:Uncharacterized protein n=1 Tax=Streptomyces subrutilus TaxID=36818 RepID=A0A918R8F2_9ACTN|nr:hypothetical protein GCM10010371_57300 [Streptomyces subrutilus]
MGAPSVAEVESGFVDRCQGDVADQHYQEFLNQRRTLRPEGEYGDITPQE